MSTNYDTSLEAYPFTGLPNTRDLGGLIGAGVKRVVSGKLLRSTALDRCTDHDRDLLLNAWHLETVIELRTPMEQEQEPFDHALFPGVRFETCPVLTLSSVGVTHENLSGMRKALAAFKKLLHPEQLMTGVYRSILLSEQGKQAYAQFFDILLAPHDGAILWNCTMGKDRAGLATVLLLTALGVSREDIFANYLATNDYLRMYGAQENERTLKAYKLPHFMIGAIRVVNSVRREYLEIAYESVESAFGSMDSYLEHALALTPEKRALLQNRYLS